MIDDCLPKVKTLSFDNDSLSVKVDFKKKGHLSERDKVFYKLSEESIVSRISLRLLTEQALLELHTVQIFEIAEEIRCRLLKDRGDEQ